MRCGGRLLERARGRKESAVGAFRLEDHLFFHFSQILARRTKAINARLRPYGLDYPRWRVLAVLQEHPGATMGELADLTSVDRTTLTRTLGLMEECGAYRPPGTEERPPQPGDFADGPRSTHVRAYSAADACGDRSGVDGLLFGGDRNAPRSTQKDGGESQGFVSRIRKLGQFWWITTAPTPTAPSSPAPKHFRLAGREEAAAFRAALGQRARTAIPYGPKPRNQSRPLSAGSRAEGSSGVRPWRLLAEVRSRPVVASCSGRRGARMGLRHPLIHARARSPHRRDDAGDRERRRRRGQASSRVRSSSPATRPAVT